MEPSSPRVRYARFAAADVDTLTALFRTEHVRRWLLDGQVVDRAWVENLVAGSEARFASGGLGLWTARRGEDLVGFTGFLTIETPDELVYGVDEALTGQGYATELARAAVAAGFAAGLREIVAGVDEPNVHSIRVLERLQFQRIGDMPWAFGRQLRFVLTAPSGTAPP